MSFTTICILVLLASIIAKPFWPALWALASMKKRAQLPQVTDAMLPQGVWMQLTLYAISGRGTRMKAETTMKNVPDQTLMTEVGITNLLTHFGPDLGSSWRTMTDNEALTFEMDGQPIEYVSPEHTASYTTITTVKAPRVFQ